MFSSYSGLFSTILASKLINLATAKWIILIFLTLYAFNDLLKQQLRILWLIFRLPGPPGHPIIGHTAWLIDSKKFTEANYTFRKIYGRIIKLRNIFFAVVAICDPEDVQKVLASSKHLQKPFIYSFFKTIIGDGLVTNEVSVWRGHRKLIQPYFHINSIEETLPIFDKGSQILIEALTEHLQKSSPDINVTSFINKCILCILSESVLGFDFDPKTAFEDISSSPYKDNTNRLLNRLLKPWLYFNFIYKKIGQGKKEMDTVNSISDFTRKLLQQRRRLQQKGLIKKKCFLDFLLDLSDNGNYTEEDCIKEACSFMLNGQDSVGTTLAFCLHQIANHPEVQEKIMNELENIFGDSQRSPTASDVRNMIYLERCIKETMRLYPVLPLVLRTLGEDVKIGEYVIPKGCHVMISIWATHLMDEHYPDPHTFNPDNFAPSKCEERHPYAFLAFSAGPRNCLGYKLALVEMKTIISNILRKFQFTPVRGKEKLNVAFRVNTRASGGVWIKLTPREKENIM